MKFLLLSLPAYGHMNPMMSIAQELVNQNHKVIVYNLKEFSHKVKSTGAEFRPPPIPIAPIDFHKLNSGLALGELSVKMSRILIPHIVDVIRKEKPDYIIHDSMAIYGKIAALITRTPAVSIVSTMALNWLVVLLESKYLVDDFFICVRNPIRTVRTIKGFYELYRSYDLHPQSFFDIFENKQKLNIVFTSEYFQLHRNLLDGSFKFVGSAIYNREEGAMQHEFLKDKKPLIYVSLGTVYNDRFDFFRSMISVFRGSSYNVIMALGKTVNKKKLGSIPTNIHIGQYLPQLEILKRTTVFISHGGMNSVNESLYFGVPMLLFPQIQEQRINAARVVELGAGIYCGGKLPGKNVLHSYVNELIDDRSYTKNAQKIGRTLKNSGGYKKAVEHILEFCRNQA